MFYAKILNGNVISYPCTQEEIANGNCVVVQMTQMPNCTIEQNVLFNGLEYINGVWQQKWKIEQASTQEIEKRQATQLTIASMNQNEIASVAS
jgi:hypothetical protein